MMAKYRKKPVIIEAYKFETNNDDGTCLNNLRDWINFNSGMAWHDNTDLYINTLEGEMRASCGDYIIKGVKGEFYPCKADIFEATYELVKE